MCMLYQRLFDLLRLLRSSDVEENLRSRTSLKSSRVVYANICILHKNLSGLSIIARGGVVFFYSETLVYSRRHISELIVPGFG